MAAPAANPLTSAVPPVAVPQGYAPAIADDVDLIEKEWVERAKQIVESTKHDPYTQNEQMTKMKTDYLKKRYNRDIKREEK
jgi:Txe/YoeB family toxin of Txe-Axe toxin-antitoxin module